MTYYLCACGETVHSSDRHSNCPSNVVRIDTTAEPILLDANTGRIRFFAPGCPPPFVVEAPWRVTAADHVLVQIGIGTVQLSPDEARSLASELLTAASAAEQERDNTLATRSHPRSN